MLNIISLKDTHFIKFDIIALPVLKVSIGICHFLVSCDIHTTVINNLPFRFFSWIVKHDFLI